MKDVEYTAGEFWINFLIVVGMLVVFAAISLSNMTHDPSYARRTGCAQALGTWRKVFEMYANDSKQISYPVELNGYIGSEKDVKLIKSLGKYTNITNTLKDCALTIFVSMTGKRFTISAIAKDRNRTVLTATPEGVTRP